MGSKKKSEEEQALKEEVKALKETLAGQQMERRNKGLPVIVLVEGWAAAGKGSLIGDLICELDPRFYNVVAPAVGPERKDRYPFLWPYAKEIPENGQIMFYDSGWMENVVRRYLRREITAGQYKDRVRSVKEFERQLRDGGYIVLKLFLRIDREEQEKRLRALREDYATSWRVTEDDLWQQREYKRFREAYEAFMEETGEVIPWHVLEGKSKRAAVRDALKLLTKAIRKGLEEERYVGEPFKEDFPLVKMPKLREVDLSPALEEEEYEKELKKLQQRLGELHNVIYRKRIPVVIGYEGWDAAGKGGAIKRLSAALDPRGYEAVPVAAPDAREKVHHYLWRFWINLPKDGHITIFDRTWYGRVMVERLEGFTPPERCAMAYREINEFEKELSDCGVVVMKFWVQIDKDEQLRRFNDRMNTPEKRWKITDEDWRNREKWDLYESAVDEMIQKTSTEFAPWVIVEGNDKKYARLKVLETVIERLQKEIEKRK